MKTLSNKELKELLNKCWMTHDGMWFYHCLQEVGIEKTNKLNLAAIRSLAPIEVKRIVKALGVQKIETFEDLKEFFEGGCDILLADFMQGSFTFPSKNTMRMEMGDCFAYKGLKRMGAIEKYECGIYERIFGWFDGLGIEYSVTPQVRGCMKLTAGECYRDITFQLK
jgi:uncharacterized protein DUF6125